MAVCAIGEVGGRSADFSQVCVCVRAWRAWGGLRHPRGGVFFGAVPAKKKKQGFKQLSRSEQTFAPIHAGLLESSSTQNTS